MGTLGSNEVDVDLIWNLPFCPLKPSRSQSMQSARQGKDKDLQNRGGNCRSQNLILGNLCLMSAPVAVVNHHCTLACPKMACMLRPINPVVLSPPLNKCNSGSNCRGFFCMVTGPCQAGFAETHYYIYLGGGESTEVATSKVRSRRSYVCTLPCPCNSGVGGGW